MRMRVRVAVSLEIIHKHGSSGGGEEALRGESA